MDEQHSLYQDLPSLKPRVSREERLAMKRTGSCPDCAPQRLQKARNSSRALYFFFLALLAIFFIASTFLKNKQNAEQQISVDSKILKYNSQQQAEIHWISQEYRHGLSILLRNNADKNWKLSLLSIHSDSKKDFSYQQATTIPANSFETIFIPLPRDINSLSQLKISFP